MNTESLSRYDSLDVPNLMAHHGFPPRTPTAIRSSDYELSLSNPFLYLLTRRYGLTKALYWSKALSRGSWAHQALELDDFNQPIAHTDKDTAFARAYSRALTARENELTSICRELNITPEGRAAILERERKDALTSLALYRAASRIKVPHPSLTSHTTATFREYLRSLTNVCGEHLFRVPHPSGQEGYPNLVIQPDRILANPNNRKLWIVDFKTCEEDTQVRALTCPHEFQTQLYLDVLSRTIESQDPDLLSLMNDAELFEDSLISDWSVGGMIHVIVRKPKIEFGRNDRAFTIETKILKSGPNKGEKREEKKYHGEPSLELYADRCMDYMLGAGDYADLAKERDANPFVNISITPIASSLDGGLREVYDSRLAHCTTMAMKEPHPINFNSSISDLRRFGSLSHYAPFVLTPPSFWPDIIRKEGFIQEFRAE